MSLYLPRILCPQEYLLLLKKKKWKYDIISFVLFMRLGRRGNNNNNNGSCYVYCCT